MTNKVDDKSIKDTGERMVPAYHKGFEVYGEHIVRYQAAIGLVSGKEVLDIASGSGYGTAILAQAAKKVYGVDISVEAINYANKNYSSKNIEFIKGGANNIPLGDKSVDIVVSFETLEHIKDYENFIKEIKRVLKEDGILILSTPNDLEFPESNHFHIHEFNYNELNALLKRYFKNTKPYFQGTWIYNALLDKEKLLKEWEGKIYTFQTSPIGINKAIYFYILCSNRNISESINPISAISEHWSERSKQEYEESIRKHINDQSEIIEHQKNTLETLERRAQDNQKSLDKIRKSIPYKFYSRLYKITHLSSK